MCNAKYSLHCSLFLDMKEPVVGGGSVHGMEAPIEKREIKFSRSGRG